MRGVLGFAPCLRCLPQDGGVWVRRLRPRAMRAGRPRLRAMRAGRPRTQAGGTPAHPGGRARRPRTQACGRRRCLRPRRACRGDACAFVMGRRCVRGRRPRTQGLCGRDACAPRLCGRDACAPRLCGRDACAPRAACGRDACAPRLCGRDARAPRSVCGWDARAPRGCAGVMPAHPGAVRARRPRIRDEAALRASEMPAPPGYILLDWDLISGINPCRGRTHLHLPSPPPLA